MTARERAEKLFESWNIQWTTTPNDLIRDNFINSITNAEIDAYQQGYYVGMEDAAKICDETELTPESDTISEAIRAAIQKKETT